MTSSSQPNSSRSWRLRGTRFVGGLVLVGWAIAGCGDDPAAPVPDTTAPSAIVDLTAVDDPIDGRQLVWTAPGDDGDSGEAASFELRYSGASFSAEEWDSLASVPMSMSPAMAGSVQTFVLPASFQQGQWYFAIKTADEVPNWSGLSNVAHFEAAPIGFPLASTEDQLVENLAQSLRELNLPEYDRLLGDGFQFWFSPDDAGIPPNGFFWDRAMDLASTGNMFSGAVGQRPDGSVMPALVSITLSLSPTDTTRTSAGGEVVGGVTQMPADARRRRYRMDMILRFSDTALFSQVIGEHLFYVQPVEVSANGAPLIEWKLLVWREFGPRLRAAAVGGRTQPDTFGRIKSLY